MKKMLVLLFSFLILIMPVSALAAPSPLTKVSSTARVFDEGNIQLVSYKAYIEVESDITRTYATAIIKNISDEEQSSIMVGMPSHINQNTVKLDNLEVIMDGRRQRLTSRKDRTQREKSEAVNLPSRWSTLTVKLEPGEYKVIDITYTTKNQKADNGTDMIYIPLEYLSLWYGLPQRVEITADLGDAPPYMFEPNPSALPHEYDNAGRLTWIYDNTYPNEYIQVFYQPVSRMAVEYISAQAPRDRAISSIVNSFTGKSYSLTISQIEQYLESQSESALRNELLYIAAMSHQGLLQTAEAVEIFNQLEAQPMFGELEGTFKNKIIYDKFNYLQSLLTDEDTLFDYLNSSRSYVMDNAMFLMWIEEQLNLLRPASSAAPEAVPDPSAEEIPSTGETQEEDADDKLVKTVTIGQYEISVEILFLGILAIVIILTTVISRRRKRKYKSRGYLFR